MPTAPPPPSSGKNVRGSANAPTGGPLPEPARPGAYAAGAATAPFGDGDAGPRDMAGLLGLKEER